VYIFTPSSREVNSACYVRAAFGANLQWCSHDTTTTTRSEPWTSKGTDSSLYHRIGGYDVIAAAIDGMLMRMRPDPQFARFATGRSEDSHRRARQFLVDQLCALGGGPCFYTGRDMKTSHKGLGITESDWEALIKYMQGSMAELNIPQREQDEVIALWTSYKSEIVE
jgi:hemoglobin